MVVSFRSHVEAKAFVNQLEDYKRAPLAYQHQSTGAGAVLRCFLRRTKKHHRLVTC